jgi:hypothetical protein
MTGKLNKWIDIVFGADQRGDKGYGFHLSILANLWDIPRQPRSRLMLLFVDNLRRDACSFFYPMELSKNHLPPQFVTHSCEVNALLFVSKVSRNELCLINVKGLLVVSEISTLSTNSTRRRLP